MGRQGAVTAMCRGGPAGRAGALEVQMPWFDVLSCVTAQRTSKDGLSHEGVLLGGWREGEPLLSVEARHPAICAGKRGLAERWRREPRGTSRLESSGSGLGHGAAQGVRDPGSPKGREQTGCGCQWLQQPA